jgi:hypothetical protein
VKVGGWTGAFVVLTNAEEIRDNIELAEKFYVALSNAGEVLFKPFIT